MPNSCSGPKLKLIRQNLRIVKRLYPNVTELQLSTLREISASLRLSISSGDLMLLDGRWYITHSGLLRTAKRMRCSGISTELEGNVSNPTVRRWVFRATVCQSGKSFVGYGDADPSNVSPLVQGAELRIAETRAVNRALRKAYGIGICSVEELGSPTEPAHTIQWARKLPPQPANGNYAGPKVRDRLCQIIRQHQLDPNLVKSYAVDFCGVTSLREATRAQVESFVAHLADWAEKDRNALLCQLNSYSSPKEGVA
jgi:hypothetical protein